MTIIYSLGDHFIPALQQRVITAVGQNREHLLLLEITINDPKEKDTSGTPIRMVRRAETNLGDFCADALLDQTGADAAVINGGGIRVDLEKGDISGKYEDPYGEGRITIIGQ